jgi:hypothetical protein
VWCEEGELPNLSDALAAAQTQRGESLLELSKRAPLLVIFLRHFG